MTTVLWYIKRMIIRKWNNMVDNFEEKTISRKQIFKGNIIEVVEDVVELPNGETSNRELVFHNGGVGILALTDENKIILVKQYRKPLEKSIWEIPAGKIERNEKDPFSVAKRELEEETAFQAKNWQKLYEFSLSPGFASEVLYLYFATQLEKVSNPLPQDEDEFIELGYFSIQEVEKMIANGEIFDAKTIIAVQYLMLYYMNNKN